MLGWKNLFFSFSSDFSGRVSEISFKLQKDHNFDKNSPLNILEIAPLSEDRKKYLYKNIRQYVDESFKDTLCPEPNIH